MPQPHQRHRGLGPQIAQPHHPAVLVGQSDVGEIRGSHDPLSLRDPDSLRLVLPEWPDGTVTVLVTTGETPHAIPVSAAMRAGADRAVLGLATTRGSLERLRENASVALLILCEGTAVTAHGQARVLDAAVAEGVVAVSIEVECVQDHNRPTFEILAGVAWRWSDDEAEARDAEVRSALRTLAGRLAG